MSFLDIKGKKVHYIEMNPQGQNTIIMLHGLFTSLSVYFYYIAPKLAKRHRVILYDMRSHGLSERRDEGYTLEILLDDLLALMDALDIDRADFVGYSYGGTVSLYAALTHPEKVARLALIDATLMNEVVDGRLLSEGISEEMFRRGLARYLESTGFSLTAARKAQVMERNRCLFENDLLPEAFRHGSALLEEAPLEQLSLPVLLLYGKQSENRVSGETLSLRIPGAKLLLRKGDHNLPVQRPHWVSHRLRSFFK
jgi:pimeloyl-ACP methyl ester carboxylesterase